MTQKRLKASSYKIISISALILIMAFLSTQCFSNDTVARIDATFIGDVVINDKFSSQARIGPQWVVPKGIGIGFVWPTERDMPPENRSQTEEIYLGEKKVFESLLILQAPKPTVALITVLLDYRQISFELDGQAGLLHQITITPGGDTEIPIKIRVDTPGVHDLIVVAFANPYNNSLDPLFRSSLDIDLVGRRAQLFAGTVKNIPNQLPQTIKGTTIPDNVTLNLGAAFATFPSPSERSHPSDTNRQLYVAKGKTRDIFRFQVWTSNLNGEEGSVYALIMFKNYHQTLLQDQPVMVINLQPNEESIIDAQVELSKTPGVDQVQIIYVFDPYKSILNNEVRAPHVFNSPRLAIEVSSK